MSTTSHDSGYDLYLKLMTDFPLPNDQYEVMDCVTLVENKDDLNTTTLRCSYSPQRLRIKTCVNTYSEVAETNQSSTTTKPTPTTTIQHQRRKPVIILSYDAWHVSAQYPLLKEDLERRGFTVVSNDRPNLNAMVSPNAKVQDDSNRFRSTITSHLMAGEDVVVVVHSCGGTVTSHALLGLGLEEVGSHSNKPMGRILSLVYLCASAPEFENFLEAVQEGSSSKWLAIDPARDVVHLITEHINGCLYNDLTTDQERCASSHTVTTPLPAFANLQIGTASGVPLYKTIPTIYVVCDEDEDMPTASQERLMARGEKELDVESKQVHPEAGHCASMSMTGTVADIVEDSY